MKKFWIVFMHEYSQVVRKRSFLIGIFATPLLMAAFSLLPALLATQKASKTEQIAIVDLSGQNFAAPFGVAIAKYKLDDTLTPYYGINQVFTLDRSDTTRYRALYDSLREEVNDRDLKYVIFFLPDAHLADSNMFVVTNTENFVTLNRFEKQAFDIASEKRLTLSNINLPVDSVMKLTTHGELIVRNATGETVPFRTKYFTAMIFVGIMFAMIIGYGALVMRSVVEEKNSRVMEVLVSSVTPSQLMMGKILGLGGATLTQIAVWIMMGATLFLMRGQFTYDESIEQILFNPAVVIFFSLFLIWGYLLFSTIFALIGSIVNDEKEAQNFLFPINMSLVLPFMLAIHVVQEPNSTLSTVLSLIPFFTPTLMFMRVLFVAPTTTDYSLFSGIIGEATLGLLLVIVTTALLIWLTAKVFRVGILMYGKRPTLPEILKWIR